MRTSPTHEWGSSSHNDESVFSFDDLSQEQEGDWGVVSHTESDVEETTLETTSDTQGVLIIDGLSRAGSTTEQDPSNLSIPGTDSLPTSVGTIATGPVVNHVMATPPPNEGGWLVSKRMGILAAVITVCLAGALAGHFQARTTWKASMDKLQGEIQRLEQEKQDMKDKCETPPWLEEDPSTFAIVDNCWVHAKGSIKLGDCSDMMAEYPNAVYENVIGSLGELFENVLPDNRDKDHFQRAQKFASETMDSMGDKIKDDAQQWKETSEALRDAIFMAGESMASEFQEAKEDTIKLLKEASKTSRKEAKATWKESVKAAKAASSSFWEWSSKLNDAARKVNQAWDEESASEL